MAIETKPSKLPGVTFHYETAIMDDTNGQGPKTRMTEEKPTLFQRRMLLTVYQQNLENALHIKNERLPFTNIYCVVPPACCHCFTPLIRIMSPEARAIFFDSYT